MLNRFAEADGISVMLITRVTGGQGLNLQTANVIIQCSPLWTWSWVAQLSSRCHRRGQTLPVWHYMILAANTKVDMHIERKCREKKEIGDRIMWEGHIERDVGHYAPFPPFPGGGST